MINISTTLLKISKELANYLDKKLKAHNEDWWNLYVLEMLSYSQKRIVKERNIISLSQFDIAALLNILDKNFWWIKEVANLTNEHRNYIKEMQFIRNKWAHISLDKINDDDSYRELDTIERFLKIIDADAEIIREVSKTRKSIFKAEEISPKKDISIENNSTFELGDLVVLKSNKSKSGAIIEIKENIDENKYTVFCDNKTEQFYESQIELKNKDKFKKISLSKFNAVLTSELIKNPDLTKLYSLHSAKIDYIPYQFRPVLKFIKSDRPRLLIADSVGVGKTIEAGLILKELNARQSIESILIICPKALVVENKWRNEMKRFDEKFEHLDSKSLYYCIDETDKDGEWPVKYNKSIIPYSILNEEILTGKDSNKRKKKIGLIDLDPAPHFDLLIVDEAHYLRNTNTNRYKILEQLIQMSDAVIFLTATPIQLGSNDLFVLLNLLRPDLIIDKNSFNQMLEPNNYINTALKIIRKNDENWIVDTKKELNKLSSTEWGATNILKNPEMDKVHDILTENEISQENRIKLLSKLENLKTFSNIINRTRRRDIGNFTIRKPFTIKNDFSESQKLLYNKVLDIQAEIYKKFHKDSSINFLMTTIKRQASSSLFGLLPLLDDILERNLNKYIGEISDAIDEEKEISTDKLYANFDKIKEKLEKLSEEIKEIDKHDSKLESLLKVIDDKSKMENNKIILFSSFKHTLFYLNKNLQKNNIRVGLIYGDIKDYERREIKARFELPKSDADALDILLFSEVGTEGLDYQFCNTMVNYDLPWNPMKIEQRIGRLDRNGQESESIAIYNFITSETIDETIYKRCFLRIGIFEKSVGENEKILGELTQKIQSIASDLKLTEAEKKEKMQQLSDNEIRQIQEENKLENEESDLFGIELPRKQMEKEIKNATSYWLSPNAQENLLKEYFFEKFNNSKIIIGEKETLTLKISSENKNILLDDFSSLKLNNTGINYQWHKWLKESSAYYKMTTNIKKSIKNQDYILLTLSHPLLKQSAFKLSFSDFSFIELVIDKKELENIKADSYPFVIYKWTYRGIKKDIKFQFICENEAIAENYQEIISKADEIVNSDFLPSEDFFDSLEKIHYKKWINGKNEHKEKINVKVDYRNDGLRLSTKARLAIVSEKIESANNEKIRKMYEFQKKNIEIDFERRIEENNEALKRADIEFKPVIFGILKVR